MGLHIIEPRYRIDRASLSDLVFGPATASIPWPQAVDECAARGMLPASAGQIWGFRLETDGNDCANEHFGTSTAAIYFIAGGEPSVAFYDTQRADGKDNILLARAQEGYDAHHRTNSWLVSMRDKTLTAMIADAEKRNRIITPGARHLALDGTYANDPSTIAILGGKALARDVQTWIKSNKYKKARNCLLGEQDLDALGVNNQHAELRLTVVDGIVDNDPGGDQCTSYNRARGVRQTTSTGNRG